LDDLKNWKSGEGDLGDVELGPLQNVLQQQNDLIQMLEDQIARLQLLLRLRQQFIALISDITTFITTYTDVVRDIEQSGQSTQDKIRRYDEVNSALQVT
jgi:nesprin-1